MMDLLGSFGVGLLVCLGIGLAFDDTDDNK